MSFRGTTVAGIVAGTNLTVTSADGVATINAPGYGPTGSVADVAQTNFAGNAATIARGDHSHQGVTSLAAGDASMAVTGGDNNGHGALGVHVALDASAADIAAVAQAGSAGTVGKAADAGHAHQGVTSIAAGSGIAVTGGDGAGHGALTVAASGGSGGLTLISRQVASASPTSITFPAIPSTYEDLILVILAGSSDPSPPDTLRISAINGSSVAADGPFINASGGAITETDTTDSWPNLGAIGNGANSGIIEATIYNYAGSTFNKLIRFRSGTNYNTASGAQREQWGTWVCRATNAAVGSLAVALVSGDQFVNGSVFSLYGRS